MLVWSSAAHVAVLLLALVEFGGYSKQAPPRVIAVDLVAPPTSAPQRAPSRPAAKPPPAPPKPKQVVLPEKPREPKPPDPKPEPKPKDTFTPPPKKEEKSLDELLADMRDEAGEAPPAPGEPVAEPTESAVAPSPGAIGGSGPALTPEELAWHRLVKQKLKGVWVVPPGFRTQPLETQVEVNLDASGRLLGEPRVTRRSGNPWFDEGVVRGLKKADPLPPPPEAGEWAMWFRPGDSL